MNDYTGRLDEVPDTYRPSCPACSGTMRRDHSTGIWSCDLHGNAVLPVWTVISAWRTDDDDE